jgi:hypothetical protein
MPVTFVRDPVTGITYSVNISGSTPTEQESARIDQFLASQRTLSVLPQAQPVEEEEIDRTAFGRGFVREPFQRERSFGVVEEALADTAFGKFFGFDAEEARAKQEAAEAELRRLELEDPSIRFEDITGLGTAASVSGEALGGEARDIAIQAGATATGAGIGGLFFGAGAVPGAAIGRTAGVAYTTAQAAPQMLAEAIEAQKEEGNEVNLTKALGATAINLLSEFVTDYFVIGKLIPKEAKSKVGSAVRSAIEAGTAEGATEVFQQAVIRGQAGQDLTSPEAIAEYAESLYSGMTVGGTIGGVGGFLSTPDRSAEKELDDDLKELREYGLAGFKFAEETEKDIEAQRKAALGAVGIDLDAPLQIGTDGAPLALPAPDAAEIAPKPVIADTEFENLSFNKAEYERVLQQVKADITRRKPQPEQAEVDVPSSEPLSKPVSNPINIPAIHQRVKADIPGITVSKVRDIMKELQARGFVAENPASKKNKFIPMGSLTPEVKTPDVSYRRQIDSAADFIKADQTRLERLQYDLRSAEAYGRDLEGNRVTPNQVNATIARVEQRIAQNQQRIELANQRLQSLGQDTHVPRIEKVGIPPSLKAVPVAEGTPDALRPRFEAQQAGIRGMKEQVSSLNKQVRKLNEQAKKRTLSSNELDRMQKLQQQQAELSKRLGEAQANLKAPEKIVQEAKGEQFREQERQREIERKLAAARARAAADQVKAQEDQGVSPVTPAFNAKQAKVFDALKKRLTNLGLKDVKLEGVQKIEGGEGFFDPVTKTITLAMGMYDPNMNDQQLFDAISEVMNHEVIHALRAMGVLKPNEMKVLERLAEKTKYVKRTKDGTQKRNYTYLDRAKSLYSDYTPTQQKEEAIAEMFRDYVAGRLKLGGGPRALFEKIKKFFKSLIGANVDNGFNSVEDIFQGIRRGEIGARDRVAPAAQTAAAAPSQVMLSRLPTLPMAPDGTRAHQLPSQLLMRGTGAAPLVNMTQKYTPGNAAANNAAIQQILDQYPNAMSSEREWAEAMQASFGGDFIPVPPMVGLQYAQSPEKMAEKLRKLTPELKKGVDKGFEYVKKIRDVYNSGNASPRMTLKLFIWGILSRGAGPVQQESAFIDIIDNAYPIIQKATRQPLTEDDIDMWMTTVSRSIPEGSPGKQVTMNVNAAANLVRAMSQLMPGSNQTVLGAVHDAMSDPNANPADIRQFFLSNTQGAGIDNKVLSFILLVGGKDDVLVMDRIQGRHLWDDGRFGGANIYDGIGKQKAGLNGIFRGPYGILTTRILENGLRQNVSRAYELIGRPEDASLGRFHWETWVIEGEQVVSHDTLAAVFNDSSIGQSVTEGKTDTLSSGMTYRRGEVSTVVEYPLSNGDVVYMKPDRFKEFTTALADDAKKAKSSTGVFKEGKFKVTARADIPWFDRPDVDRGALDTMAREYENARPDGSVLVGTERAREGQDASQRGNSDLDKRYSRLPTDEVRPERGGDKRDGRPARSLAPLEGGPIVEGATGPDEELVSVAEKYARDNGIDLRRQAEFVKVDEARAKRIADAYEAMEDRPQDPEVREAYDNLIRQTRAQYDALVDAGYEFTFFDKETDPYSGDPWAAMIDLRNNKRMAVYGTYAGYGSEGMPATAAAGNPLLQDTGLRWPDQRGVEQIVTPNDLFRAVHDAFGHSIEGAGFRARGEENAWQAHVRLFTGSAIPALTSETRGQNSWLNYGPFGEQNRTASVEDTIFAPQKIGLMPSFTWTEGRAGDGKAYDAPANQEQNRTLYSRLYSTTAQLAPQVQQKKQKLTYARSADFLAKGLGVVLPKNRAQETADTFLRKFQDNMLPVGRMIQELQAKGLTITDAMDTYLKEELFHGIVGEKITRREETIYKNALDAVKGFNITSGMIDGLQAVSDTASPGRDGFVKQARETARSEKLALAEAYLYAKHAKERNAYIRTINPNLDSGSGMTDAEADAILRWFTGLDAGNTAAVRALDAATRKIVEDTNNVRVESGLIPSEFDQVLDEDGDVIERPNYNFYVPLRGIVDPEAAESDGTAARAGSGQRFGGKGRPDPRALGRYKYATDVLATLINQNQQSVSRGERNKVGQSFLQLLRADPATTKAYAEILPRTPTRRALVGKRVREITDFNAAQDPNIFVVKEDGKDVYVELSDVNLGAALKGDNGVGAGALGNIVRTMGKINRYLANINTSYNPEFFITNFLRDLQTAGVNIQQFDGDGLTTQIVKDVRSALGGIKRSIRNKDDSSEWSQIYKDFVSAGGQNVTNQMSTVADQMENIRGLVGDIADQSARGKWNQVKNSFVGKSAGSFLSFIEDYNTVIENGIRVATYKALLDRGFTRERAAQAARNVTVNFAKGGEYKNFMNAFYLFYNASLQGSFAMLNAALRSRKVQRIWAGVIAAGLLQDQLNALLSEEEEDGLKQYDKIPDYILHHNFILPDPFGLTERSYIAIPMPYGLNMAHNIGRATSRALRGGYDAGEATSSIVGTIVDTINPLGGTENFANFFAPTVVDPFIDVMQNEGFDGRPIYKEAFPGDTSPESQRYWSTTNPSAIWVAQNINSLTGGTSAIPGFIDLSPDVMNFWLEFATGGVGRFVQRTAELPIRVFDEGLDEEIYREIPFVRKIIGSVSSREDYGRYIEKRDEILLAGEELKEAVDNRDRERALAARERFAEELRYLPRVRAVDNAIRKVNRQMNQVRDNRNLSDERRREIMDRLDERKQLLISRGNQFLADY